jgi:hypothetical protein
MQWADQMYLGLSDLAEAQARVGDIDAARQSAIAIGEGPSGVGYDMTDGQPYALIRVAAVQHQASDLAGARETLQSAFRSVRDHRKMRARDKRFDHVAMAQVANSDIGGALQTVGAMSGKRSQGLALIARAPAAAGDETAAQSTFARALADAGLSVKNPPPPNPDLAPGMSQNMPASERMNLAEIQTMAGDTLAALKTIRSIDDENYQRFALNRVVSTRATAGDVAGALRLCLDEFETPEERRAALEGLGQGVDNRLSQKWLDLPRTK